MVVLKVKSARGRDLWKTVVLALLVPFVVAGGIVLYDLVRLGKVGARIGHLELADDINLTLLELRRYEKNIVLFRDDRDVGAFLGYLAQIRDSVGRIEKGTLSSMSGSAYRSLVDALGEYERTSHLLIGSVAARRKLDGDVRPLGRKLEQEASRHEMALEVRRHEKNFLLYGEAAAVTKLREAAAELVRRQPGLADVVAGYLAVFGAMVENRAEGERLLDGMRDRAREMEKITMDLSRRERADIDHSIAVTKKLSAASLIFLIVSLNAIGYLFSRTIGKTLRKVEQALAGLESGGFAHVAGSTEHLPAEIASLIGTYNHTIDALGSSRAELERNMALLEDVNREILERQDEIIEVRKLSAMRLLASEIAHEVNNPLSSLILSLGVMREESTFSDPRRATLGFLLAEATRCREIIGALATFARKEKLLRRSVGPAALVAEAIGSVEKHHRAKKIHLIASLEGLPDRALVDPVLIHQALANVLANAFQFTPDGGRIEVRGDTERGRMRFTISNDGAGIPAENLPHVFEPFFSAREDGGGSGLGLAITQKIVERHHGSIRAESAPGARTVFTIELPMEPERDQGQPC